MQGYGLTETSPVITSNNRRSPARHGRANRSVTWRSALLRTARSKFRVPGVMLGYYNKEEANRRRSPTDGWFKTGDIGGSTTMGFS